MDWTLFWTFIAAIVPIIIALASFLWWFFNYSNNKINNGIEQGIQKQLAPLAEENTNLRKQNKELLENLKLNLQIPSYTRDYIEITEKSAEKRIEEIKEQKDQAIADKDNELAEILQSKLEEINRLNQLLQESNSNTDFLQNQIQNIINKPSHQITGNAVLIRNGLILLVRYQGRYGALQAVDQSSNKRGSFIRYSWWYQPDETPNFINDRTEYGFGETSEKTPNPQVKIGPIELAWSISGEGSGWIYFGPISKSIEYELTPTNESSNLWC
ncbi:MAG: hypothetical protein M3405_08270 [Acidobacteriota bacterium]|nr:hypothetical protein [Acidobacteriota bacterium]